jgi:hypothetical protein
MQKQRKAMSVAFIRTGERRYAVRAMPEGAPALEMNPAPGFDPLMPHDLQHFIVEKHLGIDGGVFGRLAAGGTAKSFHALADGLSSRDASRLRRKQGAKDQRLMPDRTGDYARSERATYVCWHDWLSHVSDPVLRARAAEMRETAGHLLRQMSPAERASYTARKLRDIRAEFERLSARWSALRIGDNLVEPW